MHPRPGAGDEGGSQPTPLRHSSYLLEPDMPVLFTLDLPADDEAEAERLASVIRAVRCDIHDEPPTKVRLTSRRSDRPSVFTTGCCPQLYLVVTERLAQDLVRSEGGRDPGATVVEPERRRRSPTAV